MFPTAAITQLNGLSRRPEMFLLTAWAVDANHAVLYPLGTPQVLH
jgi:hypothetical protein